MTTTDLLNALLAKKGQDYYNEFSAFMAALISDNTSGVAQALAYAQQSQGYSASAAASAATAASLVLVKQPSEIAGIDPVLDFVFSGSAAVPSGVITGSSGKWVFNQAGVLVNVPSGTAPIDFDPATAATRGLLVEEARTNQVRNPRGEGATVGTVGSGGALPTNWMQNFSGTVTVVGTGTESGLPYFDLRVQGSTGGSYALSFEQNAQVAASAGQAWTATAFVKLAAGSLSGATVQMSLRQASSGGTFLADTTANITPTSAALGTQRQTVTLASAPATTAFVAPRINISLPSSAYDFTIRVAVPQLELGAFATSPILPPVGFPAATTRAADVNTLLLSSVPGRNASEGTIYVEAMAPSLAASYPMYASLNDGTGNNSISIYKSASGSGDIVCDAMAGGVSQSYLVVGAVSAGATFKAAFSFKAGAFAASLNGAAAVTGATGSIPAVTRLEIGSRAGYLFANGPIRRIVLFPRALTSTTLSLMTA